MHQSICTSQYAPQSKNCNKKTKVIWIYLGRVGVHTNPFDPIPPRIIYYPGENKLRTPKMSLITKGVCTIISMGTLLTYPTTTMYVPNK